MNRKVLVIGGIITFVLVGGVIVYGAQNNTSALPPNVAPAVVAVAPLADTLDASGMTSSTAMLHGMIGTNGAEVSYWFEYSSDPLLGQILIRRTSRTVLNTDSTQFPVEADVSALSKSTKYYVRLVIENGADTVRGSRVSFNTK